jgi:hypothetical protein
MALLHDRKKKIYYWNPQRASRRKPASFRLKTARSTISR